MDTIAIPQMPDASGGVFHWLKPFLSMSTTAYVVVKTEGVPVEPVVYFVPNETTLRAIELLEEEEGWLSFETTDELFEYLDNC